MRTHLEPYLSRKSQHCLAWPPFLVFIKATGLIAVGKRKKKNTEEKETGSTLVILTNQLD